MPNKELVLSELNTLENDGFIKGDPEEINIDISFKPLVDKYGAAKAEYFSKVLNMFLRYLEKKKGYRVSGGLCGLGVRYRLKKSIKEKQK